ncbi:MAG TPA: MBL fold metallo-hydrolase [Pyrinomonadaceae bacterium]|nr:MBL fold metallo-hydrolase [Pyrinomonadaceae bacterium]
MNSKTIGRRAVSVLFLSLALLLLNATSHPQSPANPTAKTQIVFLGTGNPSANPDRMGPSVAIVVNGTPYIIDCGPGVVRRAAGAARLGVKGMEVTNLKTLFVTHLHSDHTLGYPDLIFSPWVLGRREPLEVYGPPGIQAMTNHILLAYQADNDIRIKGLEHANATGNKVNVHEIKPGVIYKDQNVTVKAFLVKHGSWPQAFGYRFETPDRVIVISGDTSPSQSVVENCNGCDVLIHEVYSQAGFNASKEDWRKYILSFHTSTRELSEIATKAKPKLLILYHQMFFGGPTDTEEGMLNEIRQGYQGRVVSAHDLDIY